MPSKKGLLNKKLRSRYNIIVRSAIDMHDTVHAIDGKIHAEKHSNPILQTDTNNRFAGCIKSMAAEGEYMRSKDFVMNNIEHLHPHTLKKIFKKDTGPVRKTKAHAQESPKKSTPMNEYDAMVILKWLIGGCTPDRIREHYPCYSVRQINRVRSDFYRLRTEEVITGTPALLSNMRRMAWY